MKKIIVLHGWTYSLDKWTEFSNLLKKSGFILIFLKVPGLTAETEKEWNIEMYSKWLGERLSKEKDKVILLGHSNGGRIAAYYTSQHPEKVEKLILIDAAGIYHKEIILQTKRFIFQTIAKIGKKITGSEKMRDLLYYLAGEKDYQKSSPNMKKTMVNLSRHDLTPFLAEIKVPTLIIWGRDDKVTPLSDGVLMNKLIRNSKFEMIDGARHSPFYTHPREVVEIIKNDI